MTETLSDLCQNRLVVPALVLWALLLGLGFWKLTSYANTPGDVGNDRILWPKETSLAHKKKSPTLVVFLHPHCPCSRATLSELERLMPHIHEKIESFVVFFKPPTKSEAWVKEGLWKKASAIPNVNVSIDDGGLEATLFNAKTSGQVYLYDSNGLLVFSGGITPARGHSGDNLGRDAILAFAESKNTKISKTSVFGCSLKNPERAPARTRL